MAFESLYQILFLSAAIWIVRLYVQPHRKLFDFPTISAEDGTPDLRKAVKDGYLKVRRRVTELQSMPPAALLRFSLIMTVISIQTNHSSSNPKPRA
jgi:hypothetical protein